MGSDVIGSRMLAGLALSQPAPSPTPEPISVNVPPPTVIVEPQVTVPPELLEKLTTTTVSTFAQPVATILAASIALIAAWVAWKGVRKQITADADKQKRTERLNALVEAITVLEQSISQSADFLRVKNFGGDEVYDAVTGLVSAGQRRKVAAARLRLLQIEVPLKLFNNADQALEKFADNTSLITYFNVKHVRDKTKQAIDLLVSEANLAVKSNSQSYPFRQLIAKLRFRRIRMKVRAHWASVCADTKEPGSEVKVDKPEGDTAATEAQKSSTSIDSGHSLSRDQ